MANSPFPTLDELRQRIQYNPDTGALTWLSHPSMTKTWNTRYAGTPAISCLNTTGYLHGQFNNRHMLAHRVCWAIFHGEWPTKQIDHINGDRADNRIVNLRHATRAENARNQKMPFDNASGRIGVALEKSGLWKASIRRDGKSLHLGRYADFHHACAARYGAEVALGYHPNHGRK